MASERERKRISDTTSAWDQFKNAFTPFKQGEEAQAAGLSNQNALDEAIKKRQRPVK